MARIALDAMGGDFAPEAPIEGALMAIGELDPSLEILLVGRTDPMREVLDRLIAGAYAGVAPQRDRVHLVDAPDVIEMADRPTTALRHKPNSSMAVGLHLHASGKADAFVSAGNTGAQMAGSVFQLKLHEGLTRPAIATVFPTARQPVVVLDAGANVDCSATELVQFARLGAVYAEDILGRPKPAVALLSIGEEPEKGNAAVKDAHRRLQDTELHFVGNVEGRDILAGGSARSAVDVVVCDGFVGNVLLKFYESVGPLIASLLKKGGVDPRLLQEDATRSFDYSEFGGAPLLGVRGVSIISHGSSSPRAIKNALRVALRAVETRMNDHIGRRLAQMPADGGAGA
ncbi:MAG TPA: phosphate acyltransferase PlsX [Gemmatimonadaceae bacterium]|nr:phosphate acyltransferase PlsX [Gemmatimonadaceae bacterium]